MACSVCINKTEPITCQFSLDDALENIRKHYKSIEIKLEEQSKEVDELKKRNNKLMRAVDCLKKPNALAQINFSPDHNDRRTPSRLFAPQISPPVPSPVFDDVTIIDDEEGDKELMSVMDTALHGSVLNTSIYTDFIPETENPTTRPSHMRRLALKQRPKVPYHKKPSSNDENKKPTTVSSPPLVAEWKKPALTDTHRTLKEKDSPVYDNKSKLKRLALKQTRLLFDEKRERSPTSGIPTRTMTLGRLIEKQGSKIQIDEDIFDFNKSATFQFKTPSPKKSKMEDSKLNFFSPEKSQEPSLMLIPSPTQTICFLDDTNDEDNMEEVDGKHHQKPNDKKPGSDEAESRNVTNKQNQIPPKTLTPPTNKPTDPCRRIKEEPLTQQTKKKALNPIFNYTENTEEESDDDFMVRPIQIKTEPEQEKRIDIDKINCQDCRNYIKFCGERMTAEKLEEHIRNCVFHNKENELRAETPEGFWNPLLLSFQADDPRNEVLVDDRFGKTKQKKKF